ncbi:hypothetical protein MTR67_026464 [Solanum verrucosum]|uniref:Reverse transcriptase/retrotransposon-derived protein RNase H-like domain-containing protein n=1 Tax=Solanum verrucosum TaxID=315347 RepID=A0AAF0R7T0_SOLVR|nr:hypothetical protein MTR67_026464 [Solanum verrucosum]
MCDASGIALGDILGQRKEKLFHLVYYASKTLTWLKRIIQSQRRSC